MLLKIASCVSLTFSVCLAITKLLGWEKCVYLFSYPVCVDALVPGFSSRAHGIISAASRLNVWWFVSLCSWLIYLDSALLHCCYLDFLALLMIFSANASIRLLSACSASLFSRILSSIISWLPIVSSNILYVTVVLQPSGTLCVISDGIILYV